MTAVKLPHYQELSYQEPLWFWKRVPQKNAVWLDSARWHSSLGCFSYIAFAPLQILSLKNGQLVQHDLTKASPSVTSSDLKSDPLQPLEAVLNFQIDRVPDLPPFQGGLVGFMSYDLGHCFESLPNTAQDDMGFEDYLFGLYDCLLAFDHSKKKVWLISTGWPETDETMRLETAQKRFAWAKDLLSQNPKAPLSAFKPLIAESISTSHSEQSYLDMVQKTIDYIYAGDIFEANVTQRFKIPCDKAILPALYKSLRKLNPAPYAAYLNFIDTQILSASPELFLRVHNNQVETRPIKGSRKRSSIPQEDTQLASDLLASEKDRAENVMVVDLMRNDLSRVCSPHSVKVTQLCALESFETVHHLVSAVEGQLRSGLDRFDLIRASFPGGSITGAPKIRAMEIIENLEPFKRGPYCGSIGFLAFNGDMELSITIRTYAFKRGFLTWSAGGAITSDSVPKEEYEESLMKAKALFGAIFN